MAIKKAPPSADQIALERRIAQNLRKLSLPEYGGLRFNVWPLKQGGFQANVSTGKSAKAGWTVHTARSAYEAIDTALELRIGRTR